MPTRIFSHTTIANTSAIAVHPLAIAVSIQTTVFICVALICCYIGMKSCRARSQRVQPPIIVPTSTATGSQQLYGTTATNAAGSYAQQLGEATLAQYQATPQYPTTTLDPATTTSVTAPYPATALFPVRYLVQVTLGSPKDTLLCLTV